MANFQTHLYGGIVISGGAVLALHGSGLVTEGQTLMLFGLGVVGSLLPESTWTPRRPCVPSSAFLVSPSPLPGPCR